MSIYVLADLFTGFIEAVAAFMLFDNYLSRRRGFNKYIYALGVIALTIGINISNGIFDISILNILCMITCMFFTSFLFKGTFKVKLAISVLSFAIVGLSEVLVLFIISWTKGIDSAEIINNPNMRLLGIILSKALNFGAAKIICVCGKKVKLQAGYWVLFTSVFMTAVLTIYLIFSIQDDISESPFGYLSMICSIGLLYCVFITLYLYENISKQSLKIRTQELKEQRYSDQLKHLDELAAAHEKERKIRHDWSNHLLSIRSYLSKGKYDELAEYIDNVIDYESMGHNMIDTGNTVIDAVVSAKRNTARGKGIDFYLDMQIPEQLNINASDCCIIIGNALDNAIEACEKVYGHRYIKFEMNYRRQTLVCRIVNSAAGENRRFPETTKKDKEHHGIGVTNIIDTLDKYDNVYRFEQKDGEFLFSFMLFGINQRSGE